MRIGFAGSSSYFSANILLSFIKKGYKPLYVYAKKDKKSGRGLLKNFSILKKICLLFKIKIIQTSSLDLEHFLLVFSKLGIDLFLIAGYGKIIPSYYFSNISYGIFNFHPSLLPNWKGASPTQNAIISGDLITGLSLVKLSENIDAGPIYYQSPYTIKKNNDTHRLIQDLWEMC